MVVMKLGVHVTFWLPRWGKDFFLIITGRCISLSFKWLPKNDYDKISSNYDQEIWKTEQNEEGLTG